MKYHKWRPGVPCPNNKEIICPDKKQCHRCGWNPDVAAKRLESVRKDLKSRAAGGSV